MQEDTPASERMNQKHVNNKGVCGNSSVPPPLLEVCDAVTG